MAKRLRDSITSQYVEAANRLSSRQARRRIVAYVESYDDIFFWRSVLSRFENSERYFEVMLPSRLDHLERGKKAAIMSLIAAGGVGRDMIACVDADYDYLEQGASGSSKTILDNPYIFHSYAYAIENMQCYAPSLHAVCVSVALNDRQLFDFEAFLRDFSTAIFPLFVWNIWSYRTGATPRFAISDFLHIIEMGNISPDNSSPTWRAPRHDIYVHPGPSSVRQDCGAARKEGVQSADTRTRARDFSSKCARHPAAQRAVVLLVERGRSRICAAPQRRLCGVAAISEYSGRPAAVSGGKRNFS